VDGEEHLHDDEGFQRKICAVICVTNFKRGHNSNGAEKPTCICEDDYIIPQRASMAIRWCLRPVASRFSWGLKFNSYMCLIQAVIGELKSLMDADESDIQT
jgi:hypothetical protein